MIKKITGRESPLQILETESQEKKCILHFLDVASINLTIDYLKSAWSAGAVDANNYFLVSIIGMKHIARLNFTEIFDFQKLLMTTSSVVRTMKNILKKKSYK